MAEQNSKSLHEEQEEMSTSKSPLSSMKFLHVILAVIITAVIVGGGMYWLQTTQTSQLVTAMTENATANNQIVKFNCEQSGGSFTDNACNCPSEFGGDTYDETTGYCQTTYGGPGGALQDEMAKILDWKITKNTIVLYNCEQSGGSFADEQCTCPTKDGSTFEYDSETGYCMTPFGTPGGAQGETAKKLQELEMIKNQ